MPKSEDQGIRTGLEKGIKEFNDEDFFTCHDTLEDVWMDVRGYERLFFQGLIQVSVGYYHLTCENFTGAEHLLGRGIEKLEEFVPEHRGIDVGGLVRHSTSTLSDVVAMRVGRLENLSTRNFPRIVFADVC
jgi:predicted metal-dependent hydrolase